MRFNKVLFLTALVIQGLFVSCRKQDAQTPTPTPLDDQPKQEEVTDSTNNAPVNSTEDNLGKD